MKPAKQSKKYNVSYYVLKKLKIKTETEAIHQYEKLLHTNNSCSVTTENPFDKGRNFYNDKPSTD